MKPASRLESRIRDAALSHPEATEDFPWGERAMKVKGKVFLFMRGTPDEISLSVKLPHTHFQALALAFAEPTGYGLGRSGWVTAKFPSSNEDMLEQCREWIDESYRAVAPKRLIARLDDAAPPATSQATAAPKTGGKPTRKPRGKATTAPTTHGKATATPKARGKGTAKSSASAGQSGRDAVRKVPSRRKPRSR